ncbi:MAG: hypothetical protein K2X09_00020 [Rickettsiales bacterium]|nr:hypothetical protein [Rickettsiales bacterium]
MIWLVTFFLMASCGGGGGGSDTSVPSGENSELSVTSDRVSLDFHGFVGLSRISQNINFTIENAQIGKEYYGQVLVDKPYDFESSFLPINQKNGVVNLSLKNPTAGVRSGSFVFRLCMDRLCNSVAWSKTIPYSYAVFEVKTNSLAFSGFEGDSNQGQMVVDFSPADTGNLLHIVAATDDGSKWLAAEKIDSNKIVVNAQPASLVAGVYAGYVNVLIGDSNDAPVARVRVGYTVGTGFISPAASNLVLGVDSKTLVGSTQVTFNGSVNRSWSAASDQPWLVIDTPAGDGAGSLRYHGDFEKLKELPNWESAVAHVTLRARGLTDTKFQIKLDKRLPEVYSVSPATVASDLKNTIRIFGRGFSQLSDIEKIYLGGAVFSGGAIISDREAVINLPAMRSAGRYDVYVANSAGLPALGSALGVARLSSLPSDFIADPGEKRSAFFDETRNSIYAVNIYQSALIRYQYTGGSWVTSALPIASIGDIAMAPDRKTLYAGSSVDTLYAIDPDSLKVKEIHRKPSDISGSISSGSINRKGMAITNDMRLWFGSSQWSGISYFDIKRKRFGNYDVPEGVNFYGPQFYVSGDGAKMYIANPPFLTPRLPSYVYTTDVDKITKPAYDPEAYQDFIYDQSGSKALVDYKKLIKGADFSLIGGINSVNVFNSAISPDGSKIYALTKKFEGSKQINYIGVYDANKIQNGTSELVILGELPLPNDALECGSSALYGCDPRGVVAVGALGDTLFWLGNKGLVIVQIPSNLSGAQAVQKVLLQPAIGYLK